LFFLENRYRPYNAGFFNENTMVQRYVAAFYTSVIKPVQTSILGIFFTHKIYFIALHCPAAAGGVQQIPHDFPAHSVPDIRTADATR